MWDWFGRLNLPQIKGRAYFLRKLFWTRVIIGTILKALSALRQALHFYIDKEIFFVFNGFKDSTKFLLQLEVIDGEEVLKFPTEIQLHRLLGTEGSRDI
jgi:hypothetical protein